MSGIVIQNNEVSIMDKIKADKKSKKLLRIIPGVYFLILLVIQCAAGFYASYMEYKKPYSPSATVAQFIEPYIASGSTPKGKLSIPPR